MNVSLSLDLWSMLVLDGLQQDDHHAECYGQGQPPEEPITQISNLCRGNIWPQKPI